MPADPVTLSVTFTMSPAQDITGPLTPGQGCPLRY